MSSVTRFKTCAACGKALQAGQFKIETLIDGVIRSVPVHETCSIFCHKQKH